MSRLRAMMLVHIPETRDEMYVMSIMRDLWVEVPDVGMSEVNSARIPRRLSTDHPDRRRPDRRRH